MNKHVKQVKFNTLITSDKQGDSSIQKFGVATSNQSRNSLAQTEPFSDMSSMTSKFLARRANRDSQIRVSFNPENTAQIININRPSTSQSSFRGHQLAPSYSQSVLERPNSSLILNNNKNFVSPTNFQHKIEELGNYRSEQAYDPRDPVIISSKIINRNKVIINQIADMQTFLDRAKKQNQQALKGQRFLKTVQSGKTIQSLNPSSSLLAPKYSLQRDSIQDIKALQMKLLQVKEENKRLQINLDKQQQISQNFLKESKRTNSKSQKRKGKKGSNKKDKVKLESNGLIELEGVANLQQEKSDEDDEGLANIIIPKKEFLIKRSATVKVLKSKGKFKGLYKDELLEQVPEQSQDDMIINDQVRMSQIDEYQQEEDQNKVRVEVFRIEDQKASDDFSYLDLIEEINSFSQKAKKILKCKRPRYKNEVNLAYQSQREDELHTKKIQNDLNKKRIIQRENEKFRKKKSTDVTLQTPKQSLNLTNNGTEIIISNEGQKTIDQNYLQIFTNKNMIKNHLGRFIQGSAQSRERKQPKQEVQKRFDADFQELEIIFNIHLSNGFLWIQESKMFQLIGRKEKYPEVVIDLQNLTFSINEPSQIFSPLMSMKSFNDQESNYSLEQKINKNYKIQTFIQNTLRQYPTLFYSQSNKKGRLLDSMVLNRMCHYHMHYLRRVRRTISIDLFQNLKDANISTDYLYRCDARDNFRASLLIDNRIMNQLHNFDKNNNLFKMRSGVPSPNLQNSDTTFHKILHSFSHPKIKKHKFRDDFVEYQPKILQQSTLPLRVVKPVQNLIQESRYCFYSSLLFCQPIYKFQFCHERDEKAARTEQRAINKYKEYRRTQFYGKKAKLMMREFPKEYQIYTMMQSTKLDTAFFRDQSYEFQPEVMYLCMKGERLKNILMAQKVAKQNQLGKKLSYKLGQKIYIQMAQTIEENYGQFNKARSDKEVGLKEVFKTISRITYDNKFQIIELLEPVLVYEQYKYPNRMNFDFQPLQDMLLFQSLKKSNPTRLEQKGKLRSGSKQMVHAFRHTPRNSSKQQAFSSAQNFESTANKIQEQKQKLQISSQFSRNLKQEEQPSQGNILFGDIGQEQSKKSKPNLLQIRLKKKSENNVLEDSISNNQFEIEEENNDKRGGYSKLAKANMASEAFKTAEIPAAQNKGLALQQEPYKLTVEVWKKQKESNQSSLTLPKEKAEVSSPSTISQNLKPKITFQNHRPSLSKFKNLSSQSDTVLDQQTKHLHIEQQHTALEIQLFKSVSDAGKANSQQQQAQNSTNLLNKPLANNLGIRRKSNTQIAIVLKPPIQTGSEENMNSGEDEILRDVLIDFYEYQKQGTQASQLKFEINNIQRQNSKIMLKKKTEQLRHQQERDFCAIKNKEIFESLEKPSQVLAEQEKDKDKEKEKGIIEKAKIGDNQKPVEKKGKIFAKSKPLIGEIKSQSFTDEYELLVRNLGKQKAQLCKVNKNSEINDKITQKTKSHNLVTRNGYMTCKDFKEQDDGTSYLNESFSFSSSEFSSLQQTIESKDETDSDVEEEMDDEEEQSSVVTSLNFKSLSSHLHKRYQRDNTYAEKDRLMIQEEGALLKKEHRKSGGEQQNQQNSLIKNIKNIKTQKYLTGSHSNDAFMDTFVSGQNEKKKMKKRISWFSKNSGKKKSDLSSNSRFQTMKTKNMSSNIEEDQMKKIIQAINQKSLISMKEYFKRFIGLNFLGWKDQEGNSLLHLCVGVNFIEGAEFLIHLGANINSQNHIGNTPLHNAKYLNSNKMVDFLIRYNARQAIKNSQGLTPWDINVN